MAIWYVEMKETKPQPNWVRGCSNRKWRPITAFEVRRDARELARAWKDNVFGSKYRVHRHRNRTKRDTLVHSASENLG